MRPLILAATFALALGAALFGWNALTNAPAPPPRAPRVVASPATPAPRSAPSAEAPPLSRDLLRYGDEDAESPAPGPLRAAAPPREAPALVEVAPLAEAPPQRLIGFVRRGGALHAVLALPGADTVLALPGETVAGHLVIAVHEEEGVRLRLPDGLELTLLPSR
jgi:hypothetical protein